MAFDVFASSSSSLVDIVLGKFVGQKQNDRAQTYPPGSRNVKTPLVFLESCVRVSM